MRKRQSEVVDVEAVGQQLDAGLGGKLVGIEFNPELADLTRERLKAFPKITVLTGDALELIPLDATVIFLYRPFNKQVMIAFLEKLRTKHLPDLLDFPYSPSPFYA